MQADIQKLQRLTEGLLTQELPGALRESAIELHSFFSGLVGLHEDSLDPLDIGSTQLATGLAVDPITAARCIKEHVRTAKFLRGIRRAVQVAMETFPGHPIEVLYAGCGPLAPLAIPLMTQFTPEDVQFTFLDIHQRSLDCARGLVQTLGLDSHVRKFVQADATAYVHPAERPLHMVITETMLEALRNEPQVAVTLNLAPQICAGGILIPEKITVDACLFNPATEFQFVTAGSEDLPPDSERVRIMLGRLMELDIASAKRLGGGDFPAVRIELPTASEYSLSLMLRTEVTVFESAVLGDYESSITIPHRNKEIDRLAPGSQVMFRYEVGDMPGFRIQPAVSDAEAN